MKAGLLIFVSGTALLAQIGQPPIGQYPGQVPQNRGPRDAPSRGSKRDQKAEPPAIKHTYSGVIRAMEEGKSIDVETEDTRVLSILLSAETTKPEKLRTGEGVDVETTQEKDGTFHAVSIKPNAEIAKKININDRIADEPVAAQAEAQEPEQRTAPPPTILARPDQKYDEGDSGAPKLKRGMPTDYSTKAKAKQEAEVASVRNGRPPAPDSPAPAPVVESPRPPAPVDSRKAFIEKARGVAAAYIEGLPNYICQEFASRYASDGHVTNWSVIDVVSADLVYDNHKESYRNLAINGKPSKKAPEETGAWSTGEFGTILRSIFDPGTQTTFRYSQGDTIAHQAASVYKFSVERQRSNWKVWTTGQYIIPAYKGSIWLDKENGNALRIEMQAVDIPEEFPLISVESAIDYQYVTLGTPEKFLLPVKAEVLSCERSSNRCERNVIEFRNYHKFTGESTIKFNAPEK